jgi:hypothetical protein
MTTAGKQIPEGIWSSVDMDQKGIVPLRPIPPQLFAAKSPPSYYIMVEVTRMRNIDETTIRTVLTGLAIDRLLASVPQCDLLPALGLVSMTGLARMLGMNYSTLRWHMGRGRILRPTTRLKRRAYYTTTEAEAIAIAWKARN